MNLDHAGLRRTIGFAVASVGVVALGAGTFFGLRVLSKRPDATARCPSSPCSDAEGISQNDAAPNQGVL